MHPPAVNRLQILHADNIGRGHPHRRRCTQVRAHNPFRSAHAICRRSTAGSRSRLDCSSPKAQRRATLPGTWPERSILYGRSKNTKDKQSARFQYSESMLSRANVHSVQPIPFHIHPGLIQTSEAHHNASLCPNRGYGDFLAPLQAGVTSTAPSSQSSGGENPTRAASRSIRNDCPSRHVSNFGSRSILTCLASTRKRTARCSAPASGIPAPSCRSIVRAVRLSWWNSFCFRSWIGDTMLNTVSL